MQGELAVGDTRVGGGPPLLGVDFLLTTCRSNIPSLSIRSEDFGDGFCSNRSETGSAHCDHAGHATTHGCRRQPCLATGDDGAGPRWCHPPGPTAVRHRRACAPCGVTASPCPARVDAAPSPPFSRGCGGRRSRPSHNADRHGAARRPSRRAPHVKRWRAPRVWCPSAPGSSPSGLGPNWPSPSTRPLEERGASCSRSVASLAGVRSP
jgi:hypothetical protein